jgi:hypothetical protein
VDQRFGSDTGYVHNVFSENTGDDFNPDESLLIVQSSIVSYSFNHIFIRLQQ